MDNFIDISSESNSSKTSVNDLNQKFPNKIINRKPSHTLSDSESDIELPYFSLFDRIKQNKEKVTSNENAPATSSLYKNVPLADNIPTGDNEYKINLKRKKTCDTDSTNIDKIQKKMQKHKQKNEEAQRKVIKKMSSAIFKSIKPGECMKYITIYIDSKLLGESCSNDIIQSLQNAQLTYIIKSQTVSNMISWSRRVQNMFTDENNIPNCYETTQETEEILVVFLWQEFIKLVYENKLQDEFKKIQNAFPNKKIFLVCYGLNEYFKIKRKHKEKQRKEDFYHVPSQQIELELTKLQIFTGINYRCAEIPSDLSAIILQFTKAIAETPYKQQNHMTEHQSDCFLEHYSKDCVRVDKNGNGLQRLWQQQLTQFSLARLETAEAIVGNYPSPANLMKKYESLNKEEGEQLLQDIPIRRAAGPLTTVRKIGPELSKKIYIFFNSLHGNVSLSQ